MLKTLLAAAAAVLLSFPARAHDGLHVIDPYARASAASGAVFLVIENHSAEEDILLSASTTVAERTGLHTHKEDANGVMQMIEVTEGFAIPGHGTRALARGGNHIMLLGLTGPLAQGDTIKLTLTFARGEVVTLDVPVDNDRKPGQGAADLSGHAGHTAPSN